MWIFGWNSNELLILCLLDLSADDKFGDLEKRPLDKIKPVKSMNVLEGPKQGPQLFPVLSQQIEIINSRKTFETFSLPNSATSILLR